MNDTLDQLLQEHGRQWAAAQPTPPGLRAAVRHATQRRNRRTMLAVAATVVAVLAIAAIPLVRTVIDTHPRHHRASTTSEPVLRTLAARALAAATADGDPHATAEAARTTLGAAERLEGVISTSPPGTTPVWVIQVHGSFTCTSCGQPAVSATAPTGTAIVLVLDANTFDDYAGALRHEPLDLSTLGTVVRLPI